MKKRIDLLDRLQTGLLDMKIDPNTTTIKDIVQQCLSAEAGREVVVKAITNLKWDNAWSTIRATVDFGGAEGAPSRKQLTGQKLDEILRSVGSSLEELKKSFQEDKKYWNGKNVEGETGTLPTRKEELLAAFKTFEEAGEGEGISWLKGQRKHERMWAVNAIRGLVSRWKAWKDEYGPME